MIREVVVRDTDDAPHNNTNPSPPQSPSGPWWNMRWSTLPSVRCTEVGQGAKVSAPASDEFAAVGQLMAVGRRDELVPFGCCCPGLFLGAAGSRVKLAYEQYAQRFPNKLKHCGALRSDKGSLVGFCQLQLAGDPGNLAVQEWARIKLLPDEVRPRPGVVNKITWREQNLIKSRHSGLPGASVCRLGIPRVARHRAICPGACSEQWAYQPLRLARTYIPRCPPVGKGHWKEDASVGVRKGAHFRRRAPQPSRQAGQHRREAAL